MFNNLAARYRSDNSAAKPARNTRQTITKALDRRTCRLVVGQEEL